MNSTGAGGRAFPSPPPPEPAEGATRFGARAALGLLGLLVGAVPFLTLLALVTQEWGPVRRADAVVARELNEVVGARPLLVDTLRLLTDFGGNAFAVAVFTAFTLWFLVRRQYRLAAFLGVTGVGLGVLVPVTKALVGRPRPDVLLPVVELPGGASFPSGHAMVSVVTAGVVALVLLPAVGTAGRRALVAAVVAVAVTVGVTRIALGVHFLSDVVAGWALGIGWLAVTTATFRGWQRSEGVPVSPLSHGVDPPAVHAHPQPTPSAPALPDGRTSALRLAGAATGVAVLLSALGLLMTEVLIDTPLGRLDQRAAVAVVELRGPALTAVAETVSALSGTAVVAALALAQAVLGRAVTASWRPAVFVGSAVLGELGLYFVVREVVDRPRPPVPDLTAGLPQTGSWPSGHAAAAVAVYGALAVLVVAYAGSRTRWVVLALPALVAPAVGASRVYVAAHYPSDVVAGLLLGALWLLACTRILRPGELWRGPT